MKTAEQFKEILARYYQRDDDTKAEYEDFISEKSETSMKKLFETLPSVEKKFNLQLPDEYKTFVESACSWGMYGSVEDFRIYDEREIYEFNDIGTHAGNSSIEEMKDYFMFGQDTGESSYFFDPFNRLGYGIDAVWRINRCSCEKQDFELVAKDFYELVEKFCNKKDEDFERPFENEKPVYEGTAIKDILEKQVENNSDLMKKISSMQEKIKEYCSLMKNTRARIKKIRYFSIDEERNFRLPTTYNLPLEVLYIIQNSFYFVEIKDFIITSLCDESLIERNYGKYSLQILKDMFVFASSDSSRFVEKPIVAMDYFFVDPSNILGKGSDAIYIISSKSTKLEEACYVAKDIVDLFRIFAEGGELNTTPIGKTKQTGD